MISKLDSKEVCSEGGYGCFKDTYPLSGIFQRLVAVFPDTPHKINTRFFLYKRELQSTIIFNEISSFNASNYFNSSRSTRIIVSGFISNGFNE